MDPRRHSIDGSGSFWDVGFGSTRTVSVDLDIDPLLSLTSCSDDMMTSPIWNPTLDQQAGFFDATFAGAAVHDVLPTAISSSSHYTRSQSGTIPSESIMGASRTSSQSSAPSSHAPSPEKGKKTSRGKQQRQRPEIQPQGHATGRRAQEPSQPSKVKEEEVEDEFQSEGDEETKRNHFLQRNRLAASKCRQKKKEWVNNLEVTKTGLEQQNLTLQMEKRELSDEVSRMKHQLMSHSDCNDANIDLWIENEARRVVENSVQRRSSTTGLCDTGLCSHSYHRLKDRTSSRSDATESPSADMNYDYMPAGMFQSEA
ncbi:hypothetical protein EDB80DRAFT_450947 [Ilyonectria destructans]|nr:hypothetical protein EDB80DRAFT_450947 [Ilyonectria destructans]